MKKKILFAIAFFTIALSFLVFAACKEEKITINVPEDGYKAIIGRTVKLEIETDSKKIPVFLIIKGEEYVDWITNDGELKVISGGKELVGKTINLIASIGKSKSNEVIITITDIALTAITDLSIPFAYVLPGENVEISYELYPQNTTQDDITFEIVSW